MVLYIPRDVGLGWKIFARPIISRLDSERSHDLALATLSKFDKSQYGKSLLSGMYQSPELPVHVLGRLFHHPLGLAAGMDKGAKALSAWPALGFSWIEYGGVTRFPQDGNPKPRMFRANSERALVNSMGFNNPGASSVRDSLVTRYASGNWPNVPVAANIGRSKKVSNEQAPSDYASTLDTLWNHADMFVLNVSSPNTPGLRDLQHEGLLTEVLGKCAGIRNRYQSVKPILLKVSPDCSDDQIMEISDIASRNGLDGIVATNTTITRPEPSNTQSRIAFSQNGGVSGRPLQERSLEVISNLYEYSDGDMTIVGVGGIDSPDSAWKAVTSGASLIQLYSGLVFNGPGVTSSIVRGLKRKVSENNFSGISEAIGYAHR